MKWKMENERWKMENREPIAKNSTIQLSLHFGSEGA